jgi:hypothetical protein
MSRKRGEDAEKNKGSEERKEGRKEGRKERK